MPAGWQQGLTPKPNNLKGLLIEEMVPAYLRQTYLVGVTLGAAWDGANGDAAMQHLLNAAIADAQSKLGIRFQRQVIKTDPAVGLVLGTDYDLRGERLHYFPPLPGSFHHYIPLPYAHVVSIEQVRLFFADALVYTIPAAWIQFTSKEGILRILPGLNGTTMQGNSGGFDSVYWNLTNRASLPDTWAVDYTIGHGKIDYDIAHAIGLSAAIQVLALAGSGADITGGLTTESLSQDGITESIGYYHGEFGPYTGTIKAYMAALENMDWRQKRMAKKGLKLSIM